MDSQLEPEKPSEQAAQLSEVSFSTTRRQMLRLTAAGAAQLGLPFAKGFEMLAGVEALDPNIGKPHHVYSVIWSDLFAERQSEMADVYPQGSRGWDAIDTVAIPMIRLSWQGESLFLELPDHELKILGDTLRFAERIYKEAYLRYPQDFLAYCNNPPNLSCKLDPSSETAQNLFGFYAHDRIFWSKALTLRSVSDYKKRFFDTMNDWHSRLMRLEGKELEEFAEKFREDGDLTMEDFRNETKQRLERRLEELQRPLHIQYFDWVNFSATRQFELGELVSYEKKQIESQLSRTI